MMMAPHLNYNVASSHFAFKYGGKSGDSYQMIHNEFPGCLKYHFVYFMPISHQIMIILRVGTRYYFDFENGLFLPLKIGQF